MKGSPQISSTAGRAGGQAAEVGVLEGLDRGLFLGLGPKRGGFLQNKAKYGRFLEGRNVQAHVLSSEAFLDGNFYS